jgi:hypothetical protein
MRQPDFRYRTFYTWDHSTNWDLAQPGARLRGCHEPYEKPPEAFIEDYTRLIDYMSGLGLNHLILWGALRDAHGGVSALRRLIEHGEANGVRVAPGVGVACYGGVYYEGDHEYSLVNLLRLRPDLAAVDGDGQPLVDRANPRRSVACPRNDEVVAWTLSSIRWLMTEVGPPAIHFETGDYGVCCCEACGAAGAREGRTSDDDMAELLPPIIAEVRSHATDCWLSYNHYTGYTRQMASDRPAFAQRIPDDVICKWGVSWMLAPELAPSPATGWGGVEPMDPEVRPPTATNMAHLHFGTGWWNCSPRGTLEVGRFSRAIPLVRRVGFQGICTHGEESCQNPASELNYHVYAALAEKADATPEEIAARSVGELYDDPELAAEVLTAFRDGRVPRHLPPKVARRALRDGQLGVRLNWLTFELQRLAERVRQDC